MEFCLCCSKNWRITSAKLMTTKTCLYSDNDWVTLDNHRLHFRQLSLEQLAPNLVFTRSSALIYNHYAKHKQYTIKKLPKKQTKNVFIQDYQSASSYNLISDSFWLLWARSSTRSVKKKFFIKEHKITKLLRQKPWEVTPRQCNFINIRKVPIMIKE